MAAPTPATRITPSGLKQPDGFPTKIAFSGHPNVQLWEINVRPPGVDGGEMINTTTMHNSVWHTGAPRSLKKIDNISFKAAYSEHVFSTLISMVNVNDTVTVILPDGTTICFYGYLAKFDPAENDEGKMPEASCTIGITNWDYVNNVEAGPVVTPSAGT